MNMTFEEVIVELISRNTAVTSNSLYEVIGELKEMNRTLQIMGIRLKELNEHIKENER